jgi:hypothetical protein
MDNVFKKFHPTGKKRNEAMIGRWYKAEGFCSHSLKTGQFTVQLNIDDNNGNYREILRIKERIAWVKSLMGKRAIGSSE